MAYFPNGTAGMIFQEQWCFACKHWRERPEMPDVNGDGCPVWDVHMLTSAGYSWRAEDQGDNEAGQEVVMILDHLISRDGETCWMFEGDPIAYPNGEEPPLDPDQAAIKKRVGL